MNNEHGFISSQYEGVVNEIPTISMGNGDVSIVGFGYDNTLGCISFSENLTPNKVIGELTERVSDIDMIERTNLLLTFSNTKSIDVLIEALKGIKSVMEQSNES